MSKPDSAPGLNIPCRDVVELVTDYLDGVLQDDVAAEVEAHLRLCQGCDAYVDQIKTTIRLLGRVPAETLSEQAQADLIAAFRDLRRRDRQLD